MSENIENIDKEYKELTGKKLTRKQKFTIEKEMLMKKFADESLALFDKYYPKGGAPLN